MYSLSDSLSLSLSLARARSNSLPLSISKQGLGFVVFDDAPTADDALAAMEGSEVQGKEIKVCLGFGVWGLGFRV
jgi:hypothetical protein